MSNSRPYAHLDQPAGGYVFVVTYGRSGSTLTQNLLNAIPGYCIRGENGNLTSFLAKAADFVGRNDMYVWRREDLHKPVAERRDYTRNIVGTVKDPWWGAESVDPVDFRKSLMDLFVRCILQLPGDCRVGGFKEIRQWEDEKFFATHLDIIRETFPKARFVFQTRAAASVAKSQWWNNLNEQKVGVLIERANRQFSDYRAKHPDSCFLVEYERYAEGPSYVRQLLDFLGEDVPDETITEVLGTRLKH